MSNTAIEEINFIKMKLGKSRRGKTTTAIKELPKNGRIIVIAARFSNDYMQQRFGGHWIPAEKEYLDDYLKENLEQRLKENSEGFLILVKQGQADDVWPYLENVRGIYFLVDDASLVINSEGPWLDFLATVGQNKNIVDITTHSPRGDVPKKTMDLATEIVIIGGWSGRDNAFWIYNNIYDGKQEFDEFYATLKEAKWGEVFYLKGKQIEEPVR